jgi:hypothetical protein
VGFENIGPIGPERCPHPVDRLLDLPLRDLHRLRGNRSISASICSCGRKRRTIRPCGSSTRNARPIETPWQTPIPSNAQLTQFFARIAHRQTPRNLDRSV